MITVFRLMIKQDALHGATITLERVPGGANVKYLVSSTDGIGSKIYVTTPTEPLSFCDL